MKTIVSISIACGVVQEVECPPDVQVIVRDYDVDGSESDLVEDETGDDYQETVWE